MPIPSVIVPNLNENQESDENEEEEDDTAAYNAHDDQLDSIHSDASIEPYENEPSFDQTNECDDEKPIFDHVILDSVTDAATSELFASISHENQSITDPLATSQSEPNNESIDSVSSNINSNIATGVSVNSTSANENGSNSGSQIIVDDQNEQNVRIEKQQDLCVQIGSRHVASNIINIIDENIAVVAANTTEPTPIANQVLQTVTLDDSLEYTYDPNKVLIPIQDKPSYRVKANDILCGNIPFKPNVSIFPLQISLY